jgi:integrating conjugative element protein (TIGR03756 family)
MKRAFSWRRVCAALLLLGYMSSALALNTATILSSLTSLDCLAYRVIGICYWLQCNAKGCRIRTSVKVHHYVPDAVVSSYANTGENPWTEVRLLSAANPSALSGGNNTTNQSNENSIATFRNADVIGHPGSTVFMSFARQFGYVCPGAGLPLMPYLLSTFDTLAWRYTLPEALYPESLIPGMREVGTRSAANLWSNVYPRGGFLHQADGYKASAVVAQRAGDIVTRKGQPHVYQPLLASSGAGYWPAGALIESEPKSGKWQELTPKLSNSCATFPHDQAHQQAEREDYAWALWRPYSCCQRKGQTFLGSVDF